MHDCALHTIGHPHPQQTHAFLCCFYVTVSVEREFQRHDDIHTDLRCAQKTEEGDGAKRHTAQLRRFRGTGWMSLPQHKASRLDAHNPPLPRHDSMGAFSHSAGTAPIITVIIQVTTLKTTPPAESCTIHSKLKNSNI